MIEIQPERQQKSTLKTTRLTCDRLQVIPEDELETRDTIELDFNDLFKDYPYVQYVLSSPATHTQQQQIKNSNQFFKPSTMQPEPINDSIDDCFAWFLYPFK